MKCPKCHYLSFDPEPRCRNCGFTLTLDDESDLAFKSAEPTGPADGPLADFALRTELPEAPPDSPQVADIVSTPDPFGPPQPRRASRLPATPRVPRKLTTPPAPPVKVDAALDATVLPEITTSVPARPPAPASAELPLFMKGMAGRVEATPVADIDPPAAASTSLEVRNEAAAPIEPRPEAAAAPLRPVAVQPPRKLGPLDRDLLEDLQRFERDEVRQAQLEEGRVATDAATDRVGAVKRLGAAAVDAVLVAGLAAGTLAVTLRWCDLAWTQVAVLPILPTAAFLVLVVLGYLLLFTAAGGQTIGKMLFGIRVVSAGAPGTPDEPVSFGQAIYREVVALPSVLALGVGYFPAFMADERALHDRLAHTRVVRA